MIETAYFLNGQCLGSSCGATQEERNNNFLPRLRELVAAGVIKSAADVRRITCENRTRLDIAAIMREDRERMVRLGLAPEYEEPGYLHTIDGESIPVRTNAVPVASENGRTSDVRYKETYKGGVTVVRDRSLNDEIVEWYHTR